MNLPRNKMRGRGRTIEVPSMNCRKLLANRALIAGGLITTAPIIFAFAILCVAAPAFAQSSPDFSSSPLSGDYDLPPPEDGSLIKPAAPVEATPDEATPDKATPGDSTSSAAMPADTAANNSPDDSAAAHSEWDRFGDVYTGTDSDGQSDQVLEVPQASPQPSDDADQTAQEGGNQSSDQVGSIDDYQDEEDGALMGVYGVPVVLGPVGINPFAVSAFHAPLNHRVGLGRGFQPGFVPIVPRPFGGGMNSAILPTSPMFPSGSARFSGGMPFSRGMGFSGGMRGGRR
jgi:hypothetical protein